MLGRQLVNFPSLGEKKLNTFPWHWACSHQSKAGQ